MYYQTSPTRTVDVLIFVEHRDRELAIASAIGNEMENNGWNIAICSTIYHSVSALLKLRPKVVVTPSTAFGKGSVGNLFYTVLGSDVAFVNLNYEQFISSWKGSYKTSAHKYSKQKQVQLVWGEYFKEELIKNGVNNENIYITGRPSLELVENLYSSVTKDNFNEKYPVHSNKGVCFVGLTDGLAFVTDKKIQNVVAAGANENGLLQHVDYIKKNMNALFKEIIEEANSRRDVLFVLRPHPSVPESAYHQLFSKLGLVVPLNVIVSKEEDAFWWLAVADYYVTNYSTLCLESKILGVPTFLYESFENNNVENYWYTETATKCSNLSSIFSDNSSLQKKGRDSNYHIDFTKKGVEESVRIIEGLIGEVQPKKRIGLLRVFWIYRRSLLGCIVRNIYVFLGVKPLDKASRGLVKDFFTKTDVIEQKGRLKNEF